MSERVKLNQGVTASSGCSIATTIIHVDGKPYLLHAEPVTTLKPAVQDCGFLAATYLGDDIVVSDDTLNKFEARLDTDDVWSHGFLSLIIYPSGNAAETTTVQTKFPDASSVPVTSGLRIAPGPYVLHSITGCLYAVSRLFADQSNSFVRGVAPNRSSEPFRWLDVSDASTSYNMDTGMAQPLTPTNIVDTSLRFGVKDNIDTEGLQTSNGSKDYRDLYPPREATAPCIQRLLAAGAVMIGKLRCTQWCDGQDPLERFEEVTPINSRGDGWQKPSSSSSGSASACASYSWLDFTVGTDTGGSIRHPAGVNGLFGIRPSLGAVESSLSLVCCREFDTVGVFARSASVASAVSRAMMGGIDGSRVEADKRLTGKGSKRRKFKLLYAIEPPSEPASQTPKFFPHPDSTNPEHQTPAAAIFETFVARLESHLGVQRQKLDMYDYWRATRPDPESTHLDLAKYTGKIYPNLVYGAMARDVIRPFVADFQRANPDRGHPYIEPTTKARLEYGARVSDEEMRRSREMLGVFSRWVNNVLLPAPTLTALEEVNAEDGAGEGRINEEGAEIPLLVYPQAWGQPQYRDEATPSRQEADGSKKLFWDGLSVYSLSYGSGCPDYVLPLGEVEFTSRITGTQAHLPVAISMLAPKGMDDALLGLIQELEEVGILRQVAAGNRLSL